MGTIAILGGTGPEGFGLALRFAQMGEDVCIGSRDAGRAAESATKAREQLDAAKCPTNVRGADNLTCVDGADIIVFAFPYEGVQDLVAQLESKLIGKIILDVVNPIEMKEGAFRISPVRAGSAGEEIQELLPQSYVVSSFKNQSARELKDLAHPMHGDVLLCGDHEAARKTIADLVTRIPTLRAVDCGTLVNTRALEAMTALLLNVNRRFKALTSLQILGLPEK